MIRDRVEYLFADGQLRELLEGRKGWLEKQIEEIGEAQLASTDGDSWCDYFEREARFDPPRIVDDGVRIETEETEVDVSRIPGYAAYGRGQAVFKPGVLIRFIVSLEGDRNLLKYQPTAYNTNRPRAARNAEGLAYCYESVDHNEETAAKIESQFKPELENLKTWLNWVDADISPFNATIRDTVVKGLDRRRAKLAADKSLVTGFSFPVKRREDPSDVYYVPEMRRKITPATPPKGDSRAAPEPALDEENYEYILSVVSRMSRVMELSPRTFSKLDEESIRFLFLVPLNGHYEGQATGETFNFEGKTDILVRFEGRNIFIAECKIWDGPQLLLETVDQLLGYTSWRDTKTAILLFNRRKNFTSVLRKTDEVMKTHSNYVESVDWGDETEFRYTFHHRDDKERRLTISVLAFDIPAPDKGDEE